MFSRLDFFLSATQFCHLELFLSWIFFSRKLGPGFFFLKNLPPPYENQVVAPLCPKDADGMVTSINPDQTAPLFQNLGCLQHT